jgi:hypothetical protein
MQADDDDLEPTLVPMEDDDVDAPDLRAIERLIASLEDEPDDPFTLPERSRRHNPEPPASGALAAWALQPLPAMPAGEARGGLLAWLFLGLGLMAFACGAVMLAWSVGTGRDELWSLGIPLALGGQAAVIFGLVGLAEARAHREKVLQSALEDHRQRLTMMQNLAVAGSGSYRNAA